MVDPLMLYLPLPYGQISLFRQHTCNIYGRGPAGIVCFTMNEFTL